MFFFFNDTATTEIYTLSLHDALPIYVRTGKQGPEHVGPADVRRDYGVPPELVPDFIALRGDPSDGIPGAKGIGAKTAAELLRRHGSLEAALDPKSVVQGMSVDLGGRPIIKQKHHRHGY